MRKPLFFTLFLLLFSCVCLMAQVKVTEDPPIGDMMKKFETLNKTDLTISGWRLQIMATTDRYKVEKEMEKLKSLYPNLKNVDWEHSKPYYKLRAGSFATRLEALRVKNQISKHFTGAYPAKDRIAKADLL